MRLGGRRQVVVFISGDVGIGKTTLVYFFLERVAAQTACWWARGQCVDQHGAGEAYLPVLEVVGQLCEATAQARRCEPARLMLIGTYRPVEVIVRGHFLKAVKQELLVHRQCEEWLLDILPQLEERVIRLAEAT
jgi:hypothetical protein